MSSVTTDWLRRLTRRVTRRRSTQALILMYHRVADTDSDPWGLCVSPSHFAEHLEVLQQCGTCLRLDELVRCLREGKLPSDAIVLTFDDGYADNLYNAKPLLQQYGIPATFFLTTGYLESQREFWWDVLERILLQPGTLPERLKLTIDGKTQEWSLNGAARYSEVALRQYRSWRAWEETPSMRHAVYKDLWKTLHALPLDKKQHVLTELRCWAGVSETDRPTHRTLSAEEVVSLAQDEGVAVGAHTVTHPALDMHSVDVQRTEIEQSKHRLEELLSRPVTAFSYPHGQYTPESIALVQRAGFTCACSTEPVPVESSADLFQLPRMQIFDWDGVAFDRQLNAWLTESNQQ